MTIFEIVVVCVGGAVGGGLSYALWRIGDALHGIAAALWTHQEWMEGREAEDEEACEEEYDA